MVSMGNIRFFLFSLLYVGIRFPQPPAIRLHNHTMQSRLRRPAKPALYFLHKKKGENLPEVFALVSVGIVILFFVICVRCLIAGRIFWRISGSIFAAVLAVHRIFWSCLVSTVVACFVLIFIIFCHLKIPPVVHVTVNSNNLYFLLHQVVCLPAAKIMQALQQNLLYKRKSPVGELPGISRGV